MIAEGNDTPGGEPGNAAEGRRRSEGDLLAERRARRAAESGEHALTLRAEAAEATVRTLETHIGSLQQRLRETEEQGRRLSERIDTAQAPPQAPEQRQQPAGASWRPSPGVDVGALERELQRTSQREYAEQRLRIEAEDRCGELEGEARAEVDRLGRRLDSGEREARALGLRLKSAQRELIEAEQAAAAQRTAALHSEQALRARLGELELQSSEIQQGLEAERAARERAERLLERLQLVHRGALGLLGGLAETVAGLRRAVLEEKPATPMPSSTPPVAPRPSPSAEAAPAVPAAQPGRPSTSATPLPTAVLIPIPAAEPSHPLAGSAAPRPAQAPLTRSPLAPEAAAAAAGRPSPSQEPRGEEMAEALAAAVERLRARVEAQVALAPAPASVRPAHKHSMSLIARARLALRRRSEQRKQRRTA